MAQRELKIINDNYLADGQRIPPGKIKEMYDLVEPGSELMETIDAMVAQSNEIEQLNKTSLPDLVMERNELFDRKIDPNQDLDITETQRLKILEPYVKNMTEALNRDPGGS